MIFSFLQNSNAMQMKMEAATKNIVVGYIKKQSEYVVFNILLYE